MAKRAAKREITSKSRFILAAIYGVGTTVWTMVGLWGNTYAFGLALSFGFCTLIWLYTGLKQLEKEAGPARPAPATEVPVQPEEDPLEALKRQADRLAQVGGELQNAAVRARTERLGTTTRSILAQLAAHPEKAPMTRQFSDYYLPNAVKVLDAYRRMEHSSGRETDALKGRIESMLEGLCAAFDKQLDALFRDEVLDISADITVMEQMLRREGIGGPVLDETERESAR